MYKNENSEVISMCSIPNISNSYGLTTPAGGAGFAMNNNIAAASVGLSAIETGIAVKTEVFDKSLEAMEQTGEAMVNMMSELPPLSQPPTSEYMNFRV